MTNFFGNELWNRKTRTKVSVPTSSRIAPEESQTEVVHFNINDYLTELEADLHGLPEEERQQYIEEVRKEYHANPHKYDALFASPEQVELIVKSNPDALNLKNPEWSERSFIGTLAQVLFQNQLGLAGVVGMALLPAAAAQPLSGVFSSLFTPHTGQPSGGDDLCSGTIFGCAQGYITNGTTAFNPSTDAQFQRVLNQVNPRHASTGAREQLRTCFDAEAMGKTVARVLGSSAPAASTQTCTTSSTSWNGWSVETTTTNVPTNQCGPLQGAINADVQQCKSALGAALETAKIAGIAIGCVAAAVLVLGGSYYAYNNRHKICANNDNEDPGAPKLDMV